MCGLRFVLAADGKEVIHLVKAISQSVCVRVRVPLCIYGVCACVWHLCVCVCLVANVCACVCGEWWYSEKA